MPMIKSLVKYALQTPLVRSAKIAALKKHEAVTILNLHRLYSVEADKDYRLKLFDEMCHFFKKHYEIIEIDDIKADVKTSKPKLILSFDDGYYDFFEYGVPILAKHNIRVNHNIIPVCVESGLPPLNALVREFIRNAPEQQVLEFEIPGLKKIENSAQRAKYQQDAANFIKFRPYESQQEYAKIILPQILERFEFSPSKMMNKREIKSLLTTHNIGAHSYSHASMECEALEFFEQDTINCVSYFESKLEHQTKIYAFPNGSYSEDQFAVLKRYGYEHILLVENDFTYKNAQSYKRFTYAGLNHRDARFETLGRTKWPKGLPK